MLTVIENSETSDSSEFSALEKEALSSIAGVLPFLETIKRLCLRQVPPKMMLVFLKFLPFSSVQFSLVTPSCLTLCDPMDYSIPASLSITNSQSLLKLVSIKSVMPSNHFILCRPLLLPPSIFPSIRVFSSESVLHIRWPNYWSFSFSISPSNAYSGLISFRISLRPRNLKSLL